MQPEKLLELMAQALDSEHGIEIETDDPDGLRRRFYVARRLAREAGNEAYEDLSFSISPTNRQALWIVKGGEHGPRG